MGGVIGRRNLGFAPAILLFLKDAHIMKKVRSASRSALRSIMENRVFALEKRKKKD